MDGRACLWDCAKGLVTTYSTESPPLGPGTAINDVAVLPAVGSHARAVVLCCESGPGVRGLDLRMPKEATTQ